MSSREIAIMTFGMGGGIVGASIVWWLVVQNILHEAVMSILVSDEAAGRWTPSGIFGQLSPLAYGTIRSLERIGFVEVDVKPGGPERGGRDRYAYRIKPKDRRPS